jgi:lipoprotein-releasing system permease protein
MYFKFAWRYFKGKKSTQAINIISWVSILAIAVATAALIIILSVFNGFEGFIKNLYSSYYPALKITATKGTTFEYNDSLIQRVNNCKSIQEVSACLEQKVLFTFNDNQAIAVLKGVDKSYNKVTSISKKVHYGTMQFDSLKEEANCVVGIGIANKLGVSEESLLPLNCYVFKKDLKLSLNPMDAYNSELLKVCGVFFLQDEFDNTYSFAPLSFVQKVTEQYNQISSLEIKIDSTVDENEVKKEIQKILPSTLTCATRYEQNKTLYFILKSERWAVFAILTLLLLISSFNIIGSLSMLVIDKEKDIAILKAMGASIVSIQKIFVTTGLLLSMLGCCIGIAVGLIILLIQQKYGIVNMGGGDNFLLEAYPVKIIFTDVLLIFFTVMVIGFIAALLPSLKIKNKNIALK